MPANPTTPAEQLAQWTQTLGADQSQNADLATEIGRLKSQIADITKTIADIGQRSGGWGQTAPGATQQQTDFAAYVKAQTALLETTVANPAVVVKVKADALQALADAATAAAAALTAADTKKQDWVAAQAVTATKQAAYDSYANLAATNAGLLNDLAALRTWADKDGAAKNVARMYFLILVMADVLKKLNIPSAAEYATQLNSLALDLATAGQAEKLAKIAADSAAADGIKAQSASDAARSKWRQLTHDSIPSGGAAAAVAPAAPAPVAPAPVAPAPVAPAPVPPAAPVGHV